eukprot:1951553-Prymnesium_polylepis.1
MPHATPYLTPNTPGRPDMPDQPTSSTTAPPEPPRPERHPKPTTLPNPSTHSPQVVRSHHSQHPRHVPG